MSTQNNQTNFFNRITKISVAIIAILVICYFSYHFFLQNKLPSTSIKHDEDLLVLAEDAKNINIEDFNFAEIKEKGPEFIYHLLIKNQTQIQDLYTKISILNQELIKYQNNQQIAKIALFYFELREKIYQNPLKINEILALIDSFELIIMQNPDIQGNLEVIKNNLQDFANQQQILQHLHSSIPILQVSDAEPDSFIAKIKLTIKKLINIRKINNASIDSLDYQINQIESAIKQQQYEVAISAINSLPSQQKTTLVKVLNSLNVAIAIQKADQEIIKIIKNLI
jgi:hypothetical protein